MFVYVLCLYVHTHTHTHTHLTLISVCRRDLYARAARLGAVDKYPWELTAADCEKNNQVLDTLIAEEEAKGLGGMLWRSEFNRLVEALPDETAEQVMVT
jgi:hypothetical protein